MGYYVDPDLAAIAHLLPSANLSDLAGARALEQKFTGERPTYLSSRSLIAKDVLVPGLSGPDIRAQLFAPTDVDGLPILVYLRASGFVLGSLASVAYAAQSIAEVVDVAVLAVDYRLAPEHPYPAALEDSYAALVWAANSATTALSVDPDRIAVLGDSAGGGIATALTMLTHQRKGPDIAHQFLDAPTVDDRCDTPSMREFTDTPMWRSPNSPITWDHYLGAEHHRGGSDVPILAAPARASVDDLVGLPPAWIASYQLDPTRDEALQYARNLIEADVPVELHHYAGVFHLAHNIPAVSACTRILTHKLAAIRRWQQGSNHQPS